RLIADHIHAHVGGQLRLHLLHRVFHGGDGRDRVFTGLAAHLENDRWLAIERGETALFFGAIFGAADIAQVDDLAVNFGDYDAVEVFGGFEAGGQAEGFF